MIDIDGIAKHLALEKPISETRKLLADAIASRVDESGENMGDWEKTYIAGAISALAANLQIKESSDAWLRYSLANLSKALVPLEERDENYVGNLQDQSWITYAVLKNTLDQIRKAHGI